MALPGSDEPASISHEEARQELFGRGPSKTGREIYEIVTIVLGIVGAAIAAPIAAVSSGAPRANGDG